ncbi:MAG: hypothetical protein ACRC31_01850 [Cetobacterium sp.]
MRISDIFKRNVIAKYEATLLKEIDNVKVIRDFYESSVKDISGKNVAGGIPNEAYNSGDVSDAFSFPFQFAITCKRMDNTAVCSNILDYYRSLISEFKWDIVYKQDELNVDPIHKEVLDLIRDQFENMGGLTYFLSLAIRDFMKYGLCFINPILSFKSKTINKRNKLIPIIQDFRLLDPQGIMAFYADVDNNNKVIAIRYMSMPKATYDPKTGEEFSGQAYSEIIDFTKSLSCLCSLDGREDPMGVPFLKDIWGSWRVLSNIDVSVNSNLISIGEHSYQFVPNQGFFDNHISAIESVQSALKGFITNGGGIWASPYGSLEKIASMDLSKLYEYQERASSEIAKRKGMNINNLGQTVGASANIAQFAQADVIIRASDIARQFAFQFSEGFLKQYIESVFGEYFFTKKLKDTPHLIFDVVDSSTMDVIKDVQEKEVKEENLSILESNSIATVIQNDYGNKTWIKSKLNPNEEIVINTVALDKALSDVESKFEDFYLKEMKMYLTNTEKIERAINDPNSIVNGKSLSKTEQDQFLSELNTILYGVLFTMFYEETSRYEKALLVQGKTFDKVKGMNKEAYASRETQNLLRKKEIKDFKKTTLANFMNELDNTIINERTRLSNVIDSNKDQGFIELFESLSNIKGREFMALAPIGTIAIFQMVNQYFIGKNTKDGMTLIRCGVLENQCDHCGEYMGAEYNYDGFGYTGIMDYRKLPDTGCYGKSRCRCFYISVPLKEIISYKEFTDG